MTIVNTEEGPYSEMHNVDGEGTVKYVSVAELFVRMGDDYIRGHLTDEYTRRMLEEMSLKPTEIFYMMERLQMGREEYRRNDYLEMSYI